MNVRRLLLTAVVANALLVGAAADQVIKQLPARHQIGVAAFSDYSQAADLSNGVAWYATLGIGAALLTVMAAVVGLRTRAYRAVLAAPLMAALACTLAHSAMTAVAAPLNFSQRSAGGDLAELAAIFDRFEQLTVLRLVLQAAVLAALVWALARYTTRADDVPTPVGSHAAHQSGNAG
jgi:hypothetical protein